MKTLSLFGLTVALAAGSMTPAFAHHAFNMYDAAVYKPVDGTVTKYVWTNPHTMVEFTVADASGQSQTWTAECSPINMIGRKGWTSRSLAVGDKVKFVVHPNKANDHYGLLVSATKADGTVLKDKD
jgi:hypothetical protein